MKYQQAIKTNPKRATQSSAKPMLSRCSPIHPLLQLQQTIGNRAVSRFLQTKLRVNEPGDVSEQEADRVADEVMRMPEPPISRVREWQGRQGEGEAATLQRKCVACASGQGLCPKCAEEEERMQRKPLAAQITPLVQRQVTEELDAKKAPAGSRSIEGEESVPPIVHEVLRSPGQPLDAATRAFFEPRFGYDFSQVRVHTDAQAAESARAVNALAYTVGRDVVFGVGQYVPGSATGTRMLAHELTHVVQQRDAAVAENTPLVLGHENDVFEAEATQVSQVVTAPAAALTPSVANLPSPQIARLISTAPVGMVQRQLVTPQAAGGGFGGLLERGRTSAMPAATTPSMRWIKVWFNAFIPHAQIPGPPGYHCFTGDGRSFSNAIHASSRTHQEIEFDVTTLAKTIDWKDTGTSHEVNCTTGAVLHTGKAPVSELTNGSVVRSGSDILVDFQVAAKNPLVALAPAIDADVVFHINPMGRTCRLTGEHDGFPAYEAYVTADGGAGVPVYTYDPIAAGEDITALFPPMDKTAGGTGTRF